MVKQQKLDIEPKAPKAPAHMKLRNKNEVVRWEDTNFDKIILFPTGGGFWNATSHSALFMDKYIHELMGLRNQIKTDFDFAFGRTRLFTAYNHDQIGKIKEEVPKLGFEVVRDDGKMYGFLLKEKVTVEQVKEWTKDEELKKQKIDAYFVPDNGKTKVYTIIHNLGKEVLLATDNMRATSRDVVGGRLLSCVLVMREEYEKLHDKATAEEKVLATKEIMNGVAELSYMVSTAHDNKLIDDNRSMRIGTMLHNLRQEMKRKK